MNLSLFNESGNLWSMGNVLPSVQTLNIEEVEEHV